jgi:type II secretory pathway pseudopilin PulG
MDLNATSYKGQFYVDTTASSKMGSLLKMQFLFENKPRLLEAIVYDPNYVNHRSKYMLNCKDSSYSEKVSSNELEIVCEFKNPAVGKWIYEIVNPSSVATTFHLKVFVTFQSSDDMYSYYPNYYERSVNRKKKMLRQRRQQQQEQQHQQQQQQQQQQSALVVKDEPNIIVDAKWKKETITYPTDRQIIYASVSQDFRPIINVTVKAIIYRPTGDVITLNLHDNGLNADRFKNDGVYTRYFSNFNEPGVYYGRVIFKMN